jgi:hypothetical protein
MEETKPQQEECSCLNEDTCYQDTVQVEFLGVDRDFGESKILKCRRCGRYWLHYFIEYEYLTAAGRWFCGVITPETAACADAASAKKILEGLDWYFRGGSAFGGKAIKTPAGQLERWLFPSPGPRG